MSTQLETVEQSALNGSAADAALSPSLAGLSLWQDEGPGVETPGDLSSAEFGALRGQCQGPDIDPPSWLPEKSR